MKIIAEQIFFGAIIELVSLLLSYIFKDKPRTAIVIFAVGTLSAGFIAFSPSLPTEETHDIPIISSTLANTGPNITPNSDTSILFNEDFEDGRVEKLTYITGDWKILTDEAENGVYDINNTTSSGYWPEIHFGSASWKNYEVKFRVRIFETGLGTAAIGFRRDENDPHDYIVFIDPQSTSLNYWAQNSGTQEIAYRSYNLERGIWHWVKVEARGTEINILIDDVAVITTEDSRYSAGSVIMQVGYNSHIQFDDIQVISLEN